MLQKEREHGRYVCFCVIAKFIEYNINHVRRIKQPCSCYRVFYYQLYQLDSHSLFFSFEGVNVSTINAETESELMFANGRVRQITVDKRVLLLG